MNINKEIIDDLNAVVTIEVNPTDYQPKLDASVKKLQKTASLAGFRPGKVPAGMIKKMYGKSMLADELNKLLNDSLYKFIEDQQLEILGNPMPKNNGDDAGDWENPADFKFHYELGLSPKFELAISDKDTFDYYVVDVDDKMVDNYIDDIRRRHGKFSNPEESAEGDILYGEFQELNEKGEDKEGGIKSTTTLALDFIKDKKEREKFIGKKKDDILVFDPAIAIDNLTEIAAMFKISKDAAKDLKSLFHFTVQSVNRIEKAELNKELFDKLYGENNVTDEAGLREKVREDIKRIFTPDSDRLLKGELITAVLAKLDLILPDDFLKRWLLQMNEKPITPEDLEKEYPEYARQLRWQLVVNKVLRQYPDIKVDMDELKTYAREIIRQQFIQYGISNLDDKALDSYADTMLKEEKEIKRLSNDIIETKVFQQIKSMVKLNTKSLPYEEFTKLAQEKARMASGN